MGYHYNAADITFLRSAITSFLAGCSSAVTSTQNAVENLLSTKSMQGNGAAQIKEYVNTVHSASICNGLFEVIQLIYEGIRAYETKYCDVDGGQIVDAVIDTDELEQLKSTVSHYRGLFEQLESSFQILSKRVSDISAQNYPKDNSGLYDEMEISETYITGIIDKISEIETSSVSFGIDAAYQALQQIQSLIQKGSSLTPHKFTSKSYLSSAEYASFYAAMASADQKLQELALNSEHYDAVLDAIDSEWDRRAETAKYIKLGLAIFEAIAIAVVAPTGIVGAAIVGGVIGTVNGALSEKLGQWSTGSAALNEGYDWGKIAISGGIGSIKGVVGGALGGTFAYLSSGASFTGKVGWSVAEEFSGSIMDSGISLVEAAVGGNFEQQWDRITSDEYSLELVGKSVLTGTTGTVVKEGIGKVGKTIEDIPLIKDSASGRIATKTVIGATKKFYSKSLEDGTDCVVESLIATDERGNIRAGTSQEWSKNWQSTKDHFREKGVERIIVGSVESGIPAVVNEVPGVYDSSSTGRKIIYTKQQERVSITGRTTIQTTVYTRNDEGKIVTTSGEIIDGRTKEGREYSDYERSQIKGAIVSTTKSASKLISWKRESKEELDPRTITMSSFSYIPVPD